MVKVWIIDAMYGNYTRNETKEFSSLDSFLSWLQADDWREVYICSVKEKNKIWLRIHGKEIEVNEHDSDYRDYWDIEVSTNDHYGCYKKFISRIDVDGLCIANTIQKKDNDEYIVTNTFIRDVVKPLVSKLSQSIQYAD